MQERIWQRVLLHAQHVPLVLHVQVEHLLTTQIATRALLPVVAVNIVRRVLRAVQTLVLVVMVQVQVQHVRHHALRVHTVLVEHHHVLM